MANQTGLDGYSEFWDLKKYFESMGFPPITPADYLMCDVFGLNAGCTRSRTAT